MRREEREEKDYYKFRFTIVLNRFCVQRGVYVCELFLIKKLAGS